LSKDELSALNILLMSNKLITFEQAWFVEKVFNDDTKWQRETLKSQLETLILKNMVRVENDLLFFAGDDFDRIYCKYYSQKLKVFANINDITFEFRLRMGIDQIIRKNLRCVKIDQHYSGYIDDGDFKQIVEDFSKQDINFFESNPNLAETLYKANLENQDFESFPLVYLNLNTPWEKLCTWYTVEEAQSDCNSDKCLADFARTFKEIKERASEMGAELEINVITVPVIKIDDIVEKILGVNNQKLKSKLAGIHMEEMYEFYTEIKDVDRAKYHGELAYKFAPEPDDIQSANNLGYLFMSVGDFEKAKSLFETAQKRGDKVPDDLPIYFPEELIDSMGGIVALSSYNLGIVHAMQGNLEKALEYLVISFKESEKHKERECACLFVPNILENKLEFSEILNPNLFDTVNSSLETIRGYLQKSTV
jgi:tetratricopeptide (TPR) repeat protein